MSDQYGSEPDRLMELFTTNLPDDPIPAYQRMHSESPVGRSVTAFGAGVALTRYEDVLWALKHPEVFSSEGVVQVELTIGYNPLSQLAIDAYDPQKSDRGGNSASQIRPTELNQSLTVVLQTGKPLIVSQAADPVSDRKIIVEVKATVLK